MPLVRNRSEVPHRYYDYARKAYLVWAPGEVRDVPNGVAQQVCQAHPSKMELVQPAPEAEPEEVPAEVPEEVSEDVGGTVSDQIVVIRKSQRDRYRWLVRDSEGLAVAMSVTSYATEDEALTALELAYRLMTPKGFWARLRGFWSGKPRGAERWQG